MQPGACSTCVPNFMEIVQAVKKLNSISRERLNFRRRPILCTTLYRNPMQVSNFGGTFDQLFLSNFFIKFSQKMPLNLFYTMVQKSQKMTKNSNQGGGGSCLKHGGLSMWFQIEPLCMGPVRIRHHSHHFAIQPSHLVDSWAATQNGFH